ncbi:MAG: HAMP domain-containing sensor histidine kinase [Candidatus Gracilibacteria bacterium]|nr:HAMP domain-containing sensor histidine kinase [Candidatus Gracilibacteria bacterium]
MIHNTIKSITNQFRGISEEKKLALKISGVSFLVLIGILSSIIATSYYAQREKMYREFRDEIKIFEGGKVGKNVREVLGDSGRLFPDIIQPPNSDGEKDSRGPRDILIFDKNHSIIKNDYLDLDMNEIGSLYELDNNTKNIVEIDEHYYIIYKKDFGDYTIFLTRDLTQLIEFHKWLIALAVIGSLMGFIVIYYFSISLARMVIEPIREHNASLASYSHNVAHELKTPLAVMRSNMELLKLSKSEKLIDSTNEEVISMERTIDTLLLMANPKKHFHTSEKIDINTLTEDIASSYENEEIHFSQDKKKNIIEGNPELYRRVVMNLIENALKYKSEGIINVIIKSGILTISNTVDCEMDTETIQKLTEAFYQADVSRNTQGQGLGLALVKKIVDISGWRMSIDCENKVFKVEIHFV